MALTPDDVLNKTFTTTQFRRGYDEREVDDFLDEIVLEMRRGIKDTEDLRTQLNDCREGRGLEPITAVGEDQGSAELAEAQDRNAALEAQVEELTSKLAQSDEQSAALRQEYDAARTAWEDERAGLASADAEGRHQVDGARGEYEAQVARLREESEQAEREAQARIDAAVARAEEAERAAEERVQAASARGHDAGEGAGEGGGGAALAGAAGATSAAGVLALAQRLHDEHVAAGETRRNELIREAEDRHATLISEGQARHDELIGSGQRQYDDFLSTGQAKHDELLTAAQNRHDELITEARERSTGMVHEAQQKKATILDELSNQKSILERKIVELRNFEKDYRGRLKGFITSQLEVLEHTAVDPDGSADGQVQAEANPDESPQE